MNLKTVSNTLYDRTYTEFLTSDMPFSLILEKNLLGYRENTKRIIFENVYKRISDNLTEDVRTVTIRNLHLSERLYNNTKKVEKQTLYALKEFEERKAAIDEIERVLFDGYDPDKGEYLEIKHALPKYLFGNIEDAKQKANKTKFIKEAYLQLLESKNEKELQKNLYVALAEKGRFYAQRIANTEEQRAFSLTNADMILNDDEIEFVKYTMSSKHPFTDICDFYAELDIGYGKGIVPKSKMITLPLHPFCMCKYEPVYANVKKRDVKDPYKKTLYEFDKYNRIRILGSKDRYDEFRNGKQILDIFNSSRPKYPIHYVKDELEAPTIIFETNYKPDLESEVNKIEEAVEKYYTPLKDAIKKKFVKKVSHRAIEIEDEIEADFKPYNEQEVERLLEQDTITDDDIDKILELLALDIVNNSYLPSEWLLTNIEGLSPETKKRMEKAIRDYTDTAYSDIGKLLRDNPAQLFNDYKLFEVRDLAKHISILQALDGNIDNVRLYRGIDTKGFENTDWAKKILSLKKGDYYFDRSFSSFSQSERVAQGFSKGVIFEFKTKEPKHSIKELSTFEHEDEVLIDAYQPFKVKAVYEDDQGNRRIILEEIPLKPLKEKLKQ